MPGKVQVDEILAEDPPTSAVSLPLGASIKEKVLSFAGSATLVGVMTATNFKGDGSAITQLNAATNGQAIAEFFLLS